jgi:hypothetical protein
MFPAKRIKCHVYLENVEINFSSINILEQQGNTPTATVTVPPVMDVYNILPKTICVITGEVEKRDALGQLVLEETTKTILYDEIVLFLGEFTATGLQRSPTSAEVQLVFNGFLNNWTTTPVVPADTSIATGAQAVMLGINYLATAKQSKGYSILYSKFPTILLTFINFFNKTSDSAAAALQKKKYKTMFPPNGGRDIPQKSLNNFWENYPEYKTILPPNGGIVAKELCEALAITTRHFLLNYGRFMYTYTNSFHLDGMINYVGSTKAESIISNNAIVSFLKEKTRGLITQGAQSIYSVLTNIVNHMNYKFQEFASPVICPDTLDSSKLGVFKILYHPIANMFSPIVNNVFFDDDLITMSFSRTWANEPTRVVYTGKILPSGDESGMPLINTLLSVIVPQGVLVHEALASLSSETNKSLAKIKTAKKSENADEFINQETQRILEQKIAKKAVITVDDKGKKTKTFESDLTAVQDAQQRGIQILQLTPEELLRGVVPTMIQDEYGVDQAFMLEIYNSKLKKNEQKDSLSEAREAVKTSKIKVDGLAEARKLVMEGKSELLHKYYTQFANIAYSEKRRAPRSITTQVVYSPYRVVGMPSLISVKDIGSIVAVLTSSSVTISAQGETSQNLTFSHASILETIAETGVFADIIGGYTDNLPDYMSEFTLDKVGKNLYVYFNGRAKSSLYDYCKENNLNSTLSTTECAYAVQQEYAKKTSLEAIESFLHSLSYRRLATFKELMTILSNNTVELTPRPGTYYIDQKSGPRPFVQERQDVILKIFKPMNPTIKAWEFE